MDHERGQSATPVPIEKLRNMGPKSGEWLRACGIHTVDDLRSLGAVTAYQLVAGSRRGVSLNLLWALEAGLQDRDWRDLTEREKLSRRSELGIGQ
jgi:DNA transformation protein and related proteins